MRADRDWFIAGAATIIGAVLRLAHLGGVSLWLDEILAYDLATKAAHQPWWQWLIGPALEQGPLFFAGELAGRISSSPEIASRIVPALCGIATIPIVWWTGRTTRAALAACLIAISPLHVYYSREGRP